jgi:protein TonB
MHAPHSAIPRSSHPTGLIATVLLHVALVVGLLHAWPAHRALIPKAPLVTTFIVAPEAANPEEPPRPVPMAPKANPRPVPARAGDPPPVVAAATDSPSPIALPATENLKSPAPEAATAAPKSLAAPAAAAAVMPPRFDAAYLDNPAPPYPAIARRTGEEGRVMLRVLVSATGTAESIEVRTSSGSRRLDDAALETVRRWRFVPARQGDRSVAAWVLVPISFMLSS